MSASAATDAGSFFVKTSVSGSSAHSYKSSSWLQEVSIIAIAGKKSD
jgi:hypothetical protein